MWKETTIEHVNSIFIIIWFWCSITKSLFFLSSCLGFAFCNFLCPFSNWIFIFFQSWLINVWTIFFVDVQFVGGSRESGGSCGWRNWFRKDNPINTGFFVFLFSLPISFICLFIQSKTESHIDILTIVFFWTVPAWRWLYYRWYSGLHPTKTCGSYECCQES